jgi:pyridoxal phosphate enzyme (YggS family)
MTADPASDIARRRDSILQAIGDAAARSGRRASDVALMAVTKTHPADVVRLAATAGITRFGENRVQEGAPKVEALRRDFPALEWRLIGPLQTNKAKTALQWFQVVETLDRERLAHRLESLLESEPGERVLPVLIEVNVGGEASKSGVSPENAPRLLEAVLSCRRLEVRGLMTVPPYGEDAEKSRPYFAALRELRDELARRSARPLPELSMGMSHDFAVAVEEGATEIRVGTALFGARGGP